MVSWSVRGSLVVPYVHRWAILEQVNSLMRDDWLYGRQGFQLEDFPVVLFSIGE